MTDRLNELVAWAITHRVAVIAIQEHRLSLPESSGADKYGVLPVGGDGWVFAYAPCALGSQGSVGLLMSPTAWKVVDTIVIVTRRIMFATLWSLKGRTSLKTTFVNVYGPTGTSQRDEEAIDHFNV